MSIENSLELDTILEQVKRYCSFSLGCERIENTKPSYDPLVIRRDHQRLKEALECVVKFGPMPFAGIHDIRELLQEAAKERTLTPAELVQELSFIRGIRGIFAYERTLECDHAGLGELIQTLSLHDHVERYLSGCINEYGEILDSASPELRVIRRSLAGADNEISAAVSRFMAAHSASLVDGIVTYRNNRAVLLIKASDKNAFGGIVYGDSASGQASYVEPANVVAANNRKQELLTAEKEEVDRILIRCTAAVAEVAIEEAANVETCAILDAVFAKAEWGRAADATAATLSDGKVIDLRRSRHPLIPHEQAVTNDYRLEDPQRLLLITGPNTGGKTVALKIIGLFTLMTYCGMPVTAEQAIIPYFDHVFVDIGDDQSVVSSLSSFSAHIAKEAEMLQKATENSLVLLDEIGSGTDPREGESLAIAILNELRLRHTMTVATTHYGRLKAYGKRHKDILVASVQFDMEKLTPTYKYREGITGSSNALEVAEKYGLPAEIIKYARFLKNQAQTDEDELLSRLENQLRDNQQLQETLEQRLKETEEKEKQLAIQSRQIEAEKEKLQDEAREEARQIVERASDEADTILRKMRSMQGTGKYHIVLKEKETLSHLAEDHDSATEAPAERTFKIGDAVELRAGGQLAEVVAISRKRLTIRLNGRDMQVDAQAIRPSAKHLAKRASVQPQVEVYVEKPTESVSLECNLIGMHVDDALEAMNAYMDSARVSGLKTFRIIHGDGTGALRKAVHKVLAANPDVSEFRLGMPSEGGTGATVVTMKA